MGRAGIDREVAGKRLLILGAGLWQVEYIRRARELGAETWVTDWSPQAVGRSQADHFFPIDVTDQRATLDLARRARIDAVLTAADVAVPTAAFVAEEMGLAGPTVELALDATHKRRMRERAATAGVNCPWFCSVRSAAEADRCRAFPVIVKPVDNSSSRGVRVVDGRAALAGAVTEALAASRAGEAIVEEYLRGTEGSVEILVQRGQSIVLGLCDKTKSPLPNRYDLELRYPGAYPAEVARAVEELVDALVRGFNVENAILHVEFLVTEAGRVFLLEFAIRGCGSKVITHLLPELTGIDIVRAVIRQAFNLITPVARMRSEHGALHFLIFPPGAVKGVHGIETARRIPGVIDVCVEPQPGDIIDVIRDGRSRPGHALVHGATRDQVQTTLDAVRTAIQVEYSDGTCARALSLNTWTYV